MKILFEEYHYKTEVLSQILSERYYFPINSTESKINFVGYFFNPKADKDKGDIIIIFPKVFINESSKAFEEYTPEELVYPNEDILAKLKLTGKGKVIFEISTWLYRAIQQFNKRHYYNIISENQQINQVVSNLDDKTSTELDIILSLLKFYKENNNLFTFIHKTAHSQQHKVNWHKTISKKQPIIQNNQPFYLELSNKKRHVNDDEQLLILFYSTLYYIKDKYSFEFQIPEYYDLIKGKQFESLLRKGCRILKSIKYKYFSDKMLCLHSLLYTFFERSEKIQSKKQLEEILLIKDFNVVFEDMIDDLIGDSELLPILKNHPDGKQLDHIYKHKSLLIDDDIYFVGDSKYYKPKTAIGNYSQAKQFTYAKNVIQYNIDLFNDKKLDAKIRYREDTTEGYNITPNFFISAFVNEQLDFSKHYLKDNGKPIMQYHFENRLFDRDTLFLQNYNINFLFVLSAYLSRNSTVKMNFKKDARKNFRDKLILFINDKYCFYKITPISTITSEELITKHFKLINGKVYKPSQYHNELILAFDKSIEAKPILETIKFDIEIMEKYDLT